MTQPKTTEQEQERAERQRRREARAQERRARLILGGGFFRPGDLVARWGVTRQTIWEWYSERKILPAPISLGPHTKGWSVATILAFEDRKAA